MGVNLAVLLFPRASAVTDDPAEAVRILFPRTSYSHVDHGNLLQFGFPDRGDVCFGHTDLGLLVATRDAALFNPTKLNARYLKLGKSLTLVTQQSAYDMFAYARWNDGTLVRSLSINPVGKVWESIGQPETFETPYWAGERPAAADYPLPFHPLDMAESAHAAILGTYFESAPGPGLLDPEKILLERFARTR